MTPDDFAPPAPIKPVAATTKSPKSKARSHMDGFYQHGLNAIQSSRQAVGQLGRKHLQMALVLGAILAAAALVMLWVQPEAFGIGQRKASPTVKATVTAPTQPVLATDLAPSAKTADNPAPSTSGLPTPATPR
jgi:hypothetical protein